MGKLADTILQIADPDHEAMALVCDAPGQDDVWIHLLAEFDDDPLTGQRSLGSWTLTFGYPLQREPLLELRRINFLPSLAIRLSTWEPGLFARVQLMPEVSAGELATGIRQIILVIQSAGNPQNIEVALETI